MVAQALKYGRALPHVTIAPLESRLNSTNVGLIVPKARCEEVDHHRTTFSITEDAAREAVPGDVTGDRELQQQKRPSTTDALSSPGADNPISESELQAGLLDTTARGVQTSSSSGSKTDDQPQSSADATGIKNGWLYPFILARQAGFCIDP